MFHHAPSAEEGVHGHRRDPHGVERQDAEAVQRPQFPDDVGDVRSDGVGVDLRRQKVPRRDEEEPDVELTDRVEEEQIVLPCGPNPSNGPACERTTKGIATARNESML